jgi:sigma-B regulation protein RsbU (phosphoserine phosphatase)
MQGDRLLILSDGVTECPSPRGELGEVGLRRMLGPLVSLDDSALFDALVWSLADYAGTSDFPDDVSGAMFHYGPIDQRG